MIEISWTIVENLSLKFVVNAIANKNCVYKWNIWIYACDLWFVVFFVDIVNFARNSWLCTQKSNCKHQSCGKNSLRWQRVAPMNSIHFFLFTFMIVCTMSVFLHTQKRRRLLNVGKYKKSTSLDCEAEQFFVLTDFTISICLRKNLKKLKQNMLQGEKTEVIDRQFWLSNRQCLYTFDIPCIIFCDYLSE